LTPGSIRDPGWVKNNLDHIFESLKKKQLFGLKDFNSLMYPGCRMEKIRIRDKHPGSATLFPSTVADPDPTWLLDADPDPA
jgi:hypothetical protein